MGLGMSNETRLSLLDEIQSGDSDEAWQRFCDIYEELIERWLRAQGLRDGDVDDVRQEVLVAIHSQISSFAHSGRVGAFRCWLRRVVSNRLHRQWDRKSRQERNRDDVNLSSIAEQLADDSSRLSEVWDQDHNVFVLKKLLNLVGKQFSDVHMKVFRRVSVGGENAESVADDLGISLGAVRVAQHRVMKELRRIAGAMIE